MLFKNQLTKLNAKSKLRVDCDYVNDLPDKGDVRDMVALEIKLVQ